MKHSKEILIYLLFVGLAACIWWVNAINKTTNIITHSNDDVSVQTSPSAPMQTDDMTEKKLSVLIDILDVPEGKQMRVLPARANVYVRVRVADYKDIHAKDVRVWCSYPIVQKDGLPLHVDVQDERIHSVRLEPKEVEYIINQ